MSKWDSLDSRCNSSTLIGESHTSQGKAGEFRFAQLEKRDTRATRRILLFSYAFPPMQVQMAPVVAKAMAGFRHHGYVVDVLSAGSFSTILPEDPSLVSYTERNFERTERIEPDQGFRAKVGRRLHQWVQPADLMADRQRQAFKALTALDLAKYRAIITWSPFHSINPVMVRLKKRHPEVRWIAQFSDPWARNPLELRRIVNLWSWWHEAETLRVADSIVHSSAYARDMMIAGHSPEIVKKTEVIPHCYDESLYPRRPKVRNERITLRYIGTLFGRRSPEPLFAALGRILKHRPELKQKLLVEFAGYVPPEMLESPAARALPKDMIRSRGSVNYIESLQLMYDADLLVLIEADVQCNVFVPSKLFDYMGANTPIIALAPPGGSEDAARELKCWHERPGDIDAVTAALDRAISYIENGRQGVWCDETYRSSHDNLNIALRFVDILKKFDNPEPMRQQ